MTNSEIVKMLAKPTKPNLEGAKEYAIKHGGRVFGIPDASAIKHWLVAGSVLSAYSMITRKFHPERTAANRRMFYNEQWRNAEVDKAMREAGVKAWQKSLPDGHVCKDKPASFFRFYITTHLGSSTPEAGEALYAPDSKWSHTGCWPHHSRSGVMSDFLEDLAVGNKEATKLASFGFQNVVNEGEVVVFIKLPKSVSLEWGSTPNRYGDRKMAYALSSMTGPAVVSASGRKKFFCRGIPIEDQRAVSAAERHAKYFKDGKLNLTVKEVMDMGDYDNVALALLSCADNAAITSQLTVREAAKGGSDLYLAALRLFTKEQIRRDMTIEEAARLTKSQTALYILEKFSKDEIRKAMKLRTVINLPTREVREYILSMFNKDDVRKQLTVAAILDAEDWHLADRLLKYFSAEEIRKEVSLEEVLGTGRRSRHAMMVIQLYKPEEVRAAVTVKDVLSHKNSEIRRVLMKCFDPEAILEACDAVLVSKEVDKLPCSCRECEGKSNAEPTVNELFSVDIGIPPSYRRGTTELGDPADKINVWGQYENRAKMLRYKCTSTDRVYAKFVPFSMRTANEAQAWSHHFTLEEYLNELAAQS